MSELINTRPFEIELEKSLEQLNTLISLKSNLESIGKCNKSIALEADRLLPDSGILNIYYSQANNTEKYQLATEGIGLGIVNALSHVMNTVGHVVDKFIDVLKGTTHNSNGHQPTGVIDSVAISKELSNREDVQLLEDVLDDVNHEYPGISLEDALPPTIKIDINSIFESYKNSLTDHEIDFLSSGHVYKTIRNIVDEFSDNDYSDYIETLSDTLAYWLASNLKQTPHIGKDEDVVKTFEAQQKAALLTTFDHYQGKTNTIKDLIDLIGIARANSDTTSILLFKRKPSVLFPHLEHIWSSIKFENITQRDRELIASLETIKKSFEDESKKILHKLDSTRIWPAEEAILKIAHKYYIELASNLMLLMRVASYIKTSSQSAYHATIKSFTYIQKLLNVLHKLPNIDTAKLHKCIDRINEKRKFLNAVVSIV